MANETKNETFENETKKHFSWVKLFFGAVLGSVAIFWGAFGIASYLNAEKIPYILRPQIQTGDGITLTGKDGRYFVSLPEQQIQLIESITPVRSLDVQIALVVSTGADKAQISLMLPAIQDTLITYLRTLNLEELQEVGRLFYLKQALLERFNALLFPTKIQDVLFQKIVVKEVE